MVCFSGILPGYFVFVTTLSETTGHAWFLPVFCLGNNIIIDRA
jgi:hypothetical protein